MNASGRLEFKPSLERFCLMLSGYLYLLAKLPACRLLLFPKYNHRSREPQLEITPPGARNTQMGSSTGAFIAFVLWGSMNGNMIGNYVHNYAGISPGFGRRAKLFLLIPAPIRQSEQPKQVIQSPAAVMGAEIISFEPGAVSNAEIDKIKITAKTEAVVAAELPSDQQFFSSGGAFRDQNNAVKLVGELREQGYPARNY
ncbi:MAG: hypothetical protein U0Z17_10260 [Bacteroidales bacterium]